MQLAEALLRRKELTQKLATITSIKQSALFEVRVKRINVTDNVDEVTANVPKLELNQVTAEFDFYAKRLRLIDAVIQKANWETCVVDEVNGVDLNVDYREHSED